MIKNIDESTIRQMVAEALKEKMDPALAKAFNDTARPNSPSMLSGFANASKTGLPYDKAKVMAKVPSQVINRYPGLGNWLMTGPISKYVKFGKGEVLFLGFNEGDVEDTEEKMNIRQAKFAEKPDTDKMQYDPWSMTDRPQQDRKLHHIGKNIQARKK